MFNKAGAFILILVLVLISGCAAKSPYTDQEEIPDPNKPVQTMSGLQEIVDTAKQVDGKVSDAKEMHDLKVSTQQYHAAASAGSGVKPQTGVDRASSSYDTVNIQLLTEEEITSAINRFIQLGYMNQATRTQEAFLAAVKRYQLDRGLSATGQLDAPTRAALNGEK